MIYDWVLALHVMAWTSWMAGLFYLPRIMVYHAERAAPGTPASETFKVMEDKLHRLIMRPAMIVAWASGIALVWMGWDLATSYWLHAKLLLVVALTGTHHMMWRWAKDFAADRNTRSGRFYRVMNEVPTLIFIGVVIVAIVKPF